MASKTQKTNIWIDGTQAGATLKQMETDFRKIKGALKSMVVGSEEYLEMLKKVQFASKQLDQHRQSIRGISSAFTEAKSGVKDMMMQFGPVAGVLAITSAGIAGVGNAVYSWYRNNKELEKSLSSLQSLTGASTEDLKFYKREAIQIGKETSMSASQVVEAYKLIGSARPDLLKNKEALSEVTKQTVVLAEAAEMDLGAAAASMAGTMNQFNLSAEHSERIINALAAGSKEGAAEISDITQSMEKFGTVAAANNVTVEESIGITELLAEKNLKGAEAGEKIKNVLLTLATASALPDEAVKSMEKYGVNMDVVMNKALPLKDRLTEMAKVHKDQTALLKIFGKENVTAGQIILSNVQKYDELTTAVTGTNTAYEQQKINNDNLEGDLKKMDSAWEGFTLAIGGGGDALRGVVQVGTDVLNWTSDLITAFKEADSMKLQTQFMKLADAMTFGVGAAHDFLQQMIRVNEISMEVIDSTKAEVEANVVLTESLAKNNEALEKGNLTSEERGRIETENEKIIDTLKDKYKELTAGLDLHKLSTKELISLQKEMNKTLLEQTLQTVQAAEAERLLSVVVESTMKAQLANAEMKRLQKAGGFMNMMLAGDKAKEKMEALKELHDAEKQLAGLGKTMELVKKNLQGLDLTYGSKFKIQDDIIADSQKKLQQAIKLLEKTTDPGKRKALEAFITGLRQTISNASKGNQQALDDLITKNEEVLESDEKVTHQVTKSEQKRADDKIKSYNKMKDELGKLISDVDKLQKELVNGNSKDGISDPMQQELFELQDHIQKKYEAEIQAAIKLMSDKGDIGIKATEQYNRLIALEDEDYEREKAKIQEKYRKAKAEKDYEAEKQANLRFLEQQRTLEDAKADLKVTKAKAALNAIREGDLSGYRLAKADLEKALAEQAELQKKRRIEALMDERDNDIISLEEYNARKEQIELDHQQAIIDINSQTNEELKRIDDDRAQNALENIAAILDIAKQFSDASSKEQFNTLNRQQKAEEKSLNDSLKAKKITDEQYQEQKKQIEEKYAKRKYEVELEQFKKNQAFAVSEAFIQGALAIAKITAQTGVAAPLAIPLVIASTAAQVANILSQEPPEAPQFFEGGYADVIGQKDGLRYRAQKIGKLKPGYTPNRPVLGLFGERGTEYVIPNHLLRRQPVARFVNMIEAERTSRVPQFADGGFTGNMGWSDDTVAVLEQNRRATDRLSDILENGISTKFDDRNVEDLEKAQNRLNIVRK